MRISVHIPVRDGALYLGQALDSIAAQERLPDQVVVVDDGSTDDSADIAEAHPVRPLVVRLPPSGVAVARNTALAASPEADLIAFLDSDDLWLPRHLAALEAGMQPDFDMVSGHMEQFVSPDLTPEEQAQLVVPPGQQPGLIAGATMVRRACFDRAGIFDTAQRAGDFISWFLASRDAGMRHRLLPDLVLRRRLHRSNLGRTHADFRADYVRLVRAAMLRRRAAASDPDRGS